jgi:carbon monoxide dehydrogenase subunit G
MTTFTAHQRSEARVPHPRSAIWAVLADPDLVAKMTPMVRGIRGTGSHWHWQLPSVPVLGRSFDLNFTEAMTFHPESRIDFRHDPVGSERAGTDGGYDLADAPDGQTDLTIDLTVTVDLPFPRLARPAVQGTMHAVLTAMGAGFARAIERHLGANHSAP